MSADRRLAAVVLAGGASRRFGSDKLVAEVSGAPLLDRALEGLPESALIVVVGPQRSVRRPVRHVREDPPGGGPAAAMVAGLRVALESGAEEILVLPGDAPGAGSAALLLWRGLLGGDAAAVVGTDSSGFEQPLQLALRRSAGEMLVRAAGTDGAWGGSARALVNRLDPPALRWPLTAPASFDIDTPEQLQAWTERDSAAVSSVLAAVDARPVTGGHPFVLALDGRSGAGTSTLAAALSLRRPAVVLAGADFHSTRLAAMDPGQRLRLADADVADLVLDWRRLATEALTPLRNGRSARFARHDGQAQDGRPGAATDLAPQDLVVVEGVYSARPELAELVDLAVYVDAAPATRRRRLTRRRDDSDWADVWERGENHYFHHIRPPESFDLQVTSAG